MVQNRNKLIELFIGNISNSIVHKILEKATAQKELSDKYIVKAIRFLPFSYVFSLIPKA